jgi:hypothetical protein
MLSRTIHEMEINERYPEAIDALESALEEQPSCGVAARLAFNLWFVYIESFGFPQSLPFEQYRKRFVSLYRQYRDRCWNCADFCWACGLGISMFGYHFDIAQEEGDRLLQRATELSEFWARMSQQEASEDEMRRYLAGKGIFECYYNVSG